MKLFERMSKEEWNEILQRVAEDTRMTVGLTDENGNLVLQTQGERCALCTKIRERKESLTFICSQCNTAMLEEAKQALKPVLDSCDAGLTRMVVPILNEGVLIGQLTACGGAPEKEEIDLFLIARQVGTTEDEVAVLATRIPVVSTDEIETIANRTFAEVNA